MKDNELGTSRILNASRQQVFEAWTNPNLLKEWWGPNGFKNTFSEFDLRPGGKWNFVMHGPNGTDYDNNMIFVEITKPIKIVLDHLTAPVFRVVANFEEVSPEKTKYSFTMIFPTKEICDQMRNFVTEPNEQNIDRLEAVLAQMK